MVRFGVSLPALMQLLGHKDIRMTLRYVLVTQQDLQHEFHAARQNAAQPHRLPNLSISNLSIPNPPQAPTFPASVKSCLPRATSWRCIAATRR